MIAGCQFGVRLLRALHGANQFMLEQFNTTRTRLPTLDVRRLDNDALNLGRAFKHPLNFFGSHGRSGVEHELRVFFDIYRNAIAKLVVDYVRSVSNAAQQISRTKHIR